MKIDKSKLKRISIDLLKHGLPIEVKYDKNIEITWCKDNETETIEYLNNNCNVVITQPTSQAVKYGYIIQSAYEDYTF